MVIVTRRAIVLGLMGLGTAAICRVEAQSGGDLFDASTLHQIDLWMNSRDVQQIRLHYDLNTHYPAEFQWNGSSASRL